MRTTTATITFQRPFMLPGFDRPHAPGTFEVRTDEESLDTSFDAWRRIATRILLVSGGSVQAWPVEPRDLDAAIAIDRAGPR